MTGDAESLTKMKLMIEAMIDQIKHIAVSVTDIRDVDIYADLADFVHQCGVVEGLLQAMKDELNMRIEYLEANGDNG